MKILTVYKSKTGFTKRYAEWIAHELACALIPYEEFKLDLVGNYDTIIFGSRVHAGRIDGFNKFKKLIKDTNIKLIVFAVGAAPAEAVNVIEKIWSSNLPANELKKIPHFYMQGGLDYEKMTGGDRFIMKSLAKMLTQKNEKNSEESACLQSIKSSYDASCKENILPLIDYIKKCQ